ncbi:MAG: glycosyltransferase family 39 protein [Azonexus sp.]
MGDKIIVEKESSATNLANRTAAWPLGGVIGLTLAYGLVHALTRLGSSHNLGEREPSENIYAQTLAAGYSPDQLPLYDWLIWLLQQALGPDVYSFLTFKYSMLAALAGFMFLVARRVTGSIPWALVAVESMALIYQIFWRWHETHTHLIGAMVFSLAATWALMRAVDQQRWRDYAMLGIAIGLGCLTQLTFPPFILALALAGAWQAPVRQRLFTRQWLLALPLALLIVAPYAFWLMQEPGRLAAFAASLRPAAWADTGASPWLALWEGIQTPLLALSPYLLFLFIIFPRVFSALLSHCRAAKNEAEVDWTRLLVHTILLEWGVFLVVSVSAGLQRYSVQDLLPLFLIAIVVLADGARRSTPPELAKQRYMRLALVISLIALLVRLAHMYVHEPICKTCRWGEPYAALATQLRETGFRQGTIFTADSALGGNLRAYLPESQVILAPLGKLPSTCPTQPCLVINPGKPTPGSALATGARAIEVPWQHLWKPTGYRVSSWWFVLPEETPGQPQ